MASKYSQKTAISLYKFDTEDGYRQWLAANTPKSDAQDIVAIVKNEKMNNGLDLFVNGHSLTKTKIYLKKGESVTEVTDSNNVFDATKQYVVLSMSRRGLGQKNILVLEEIDINKSIDDKIKEFSDSGLTDRINDYLDDYLDDYFESHPIQSEIADVKKLEGILTNTHYMFRKIFSLLYKERAIHLGLSVKYLDSANNVIEPFVEHKEEKVIKTIQTRITGMTGKDVTLESLSFYKNDSETPLLTVSGQKLVSGANPDLKVNITISEDTTIHAVLRYTMNRLVDTAKTNNIQNFDSSVFFKSKTEKACCCSKFYIVQPELSLSVDTLNFDWQSSIQSISVIANNPWRISTIDDNDWVSVNTSKVDNEQTMVYIKTETNERTSNRTARLSFDIDGGESKVLTIVQSKTGTNLNVSPSSLSFDAVGGKKELSVSANYSWTVEENSDWIELETEGEVVRVVVKENTNTSKRTALISFTSNNMKKDISVTQNGAPATKVYDKSYIVFIPTEYDEDGYTKLKSPYDTIPNVESVNWMVTSNYDDVEVLEFDIEYNKSANYEFPFIVPSGKDENYQIYVLVPIRDVNIPADLNDLNTPIKISASNFDDNITEKCDVGSYNGLDYILFKQSFAQGAGQSFIYKITTK